MTSYFYNFLLSITTVTGITVFDKCYIPHPYV